MHPHFVVCRPEETGPISNENDHSPSPARGTGRWTAGYQVVTW